MTDKYEIVQQDIISKIEQGIFVPDKPLPTELEMVDFYNVSRTTVRRAMKDLVLQGLLERIAGKGTFVKKQIKTSGDKAHQALYSIILPSHLPEQMKTIQGAQQYFSQHGCNLSIHFTERGKNEIEILKDVLASSSKGIIASLYTSHSKYIKHFFKMQNSNIPIVLLDRKIYGLTSNLITSDNFNGMYSIVNHLIKCGHKRIGYFSYNTLTSSCLIDRFRGYIQCLTDNNIPFDPSIVSIKVKRRSEFDSEIERICNSNTGTTAIACSMDELAIPVYEWAKRNNVSIPDELSVTGFDNMITTSSLIPSLTTIEQDFFQMGYSAAALAMELQSTGSEFKKEIYLPTKLVVKYSVKTLI